VLQRPLRVNLVVLTARRSLPFCLDKRHFQSPSACLKGANSGNTPVAKGVSRNVILCDMGGAGLLSHSCRRMGVTRRTGGLR
jgi:hypothetical protein